PLPDARYTVVSDGNSRKVVRVHLDERDVRGGIAPDDLRGEGAIIQQSYCHAIGVGHYVIVGEDVAVLRHDESGARTAARLRVLIVELTEEVFHAGRQISA